MSKSRKKKKKEVNKVVLFTILFVINIYIFSILHEACHVKIAYYFNVPVIRANIFTLDLLFDDRNLTPEQHTSYYFLQSLVEIITLPVFGMFLGIYFFLIARIDDHDRHQ